MAPAHVLPRFLRMPVMQQGRQTSSYQQQTTRQQQQHVLLHLLQPWHQSLHQHQKHQQSLWDQKP